MKRVAVPLLLGGGLLLLAFWLTRDPSETSQEAPLLDREEAAVEQASGPALQGRPLPPASPLADRDRFTLRGLVVDEDDLPVAGVAVRCLHAPRRPRDRHTSWSAFDKAQRGRARQVLVGKAVRADDDGRFEIPGLFVDEQYYAGFRPAAPYAEMLRNIRHTRPGIHEMRFVLRRGAAFRGRVVDADGRGVRAYVSAFGDLDESLLHWLPPRETDAEGRFSVAALPDARWSFTVAVAGRGLRGGIPVRTPTSGEVVLPFRLAEGGTIAGRVTDMQDRPIGGAGVLVELQGRGVGQELFVQALAVTDTRGRYRLEGLDPGRIGGITVEAEGFATVSGLYNRFPVEVGATLDADVVLARGTILRGRVLDGAGSTVPGAVVRLSIRLPSRGSFPSSSRRSTVADGDGRFAFERLQPLGVGTLSAYAVDAATDAPTPGDPTLRISLEHEGGVIERDVVLAAVPLLRGVVLDAAGRPVGDAQVSAQSAQARGRQDDGVSLPRAVSAADGSFVLHGLVPGESWTFDAEKGTGRCESHPAVPVPYPPEQAPAVRLVLREGAVLRGRVVDAEGSGFPRYRVVLNGLHPSGRGKASLSVRADEDGHFVFEGLRAGRYTLSRGRWDGEKDGAGMQRFDLAWGQVVEGVTVVRVPAQIISGVVVDASGQPVPRATVEFQRQGSADSHARGIDVARSDGRFRLRVAAGTYNVWVRGGDTPMEIEAGTTDVTLQTTVSPTRELLGLVVDAAGHPVPRAKVTIWVREHGDSLRGHGASCMMGRFHASLETQKPLVDVVVEGARDAAGHPLDLQPGVWTGVALEGGELRCRLEPGLRVEGCVVDASGDGIGDVRIEVSLARHDTSWLSGYGRHVGLPRVRTDAEGRFVLLGLGPEPLRLRVRPPVSWIEPPALQVVPGQDPLELRLVPGHELGGRVLDADGAPVAGARVRVRWPTDDEGVAGLREPQGKTDEQGAFHLSRLRAGPLTLVVEGESFASWPYRRVELEGVEVDTLDLVLRLERGRDLAGVVVDPEGIPVERGSVSIWGRREGRPPTFQSVSVDENGRFVVPEIEPGTYELVGSGGSEFAPSARTAVVVPAEDVRLVLGRTWLLHGTVVGRPDVQKQLRFLYHAGGEPQLEGIGYADAGPFSFRVRTDRIGTLLLRIEETGEYALIENVKPGSGPHRLVPKAGWAIEGRIEGGPIDAGSHQVSGLDTRGIRIRAPVQADGTFRFRGVPPGVYRLEAWVPRDGQYLHFLAEGVEAGAKGVLLHRAP